MNPGSVSLGRSAAESGRTIEVRLDSGLDFADRLVRAPVMDILHPRYLRVNTYAEPHSLPLSLSKGAAITTVSPETATEAPK